MPERKIKNSAADRLDELFVSGQRELRSIASYLKRSDGSLTLNVTALVNEVYLKLRQASPDVQSELHLRRMAGQAMRQILADAARKRSAQKRGGGDIQFVEWDENFEPFITSDRDLLAVDAALTELAAVEPRQADAVECHFFGGLSWKEVADGQGVSTATVERDWRVVRAWLAKKVSEHR